MSEMDKARAWSEEQQAGEPAPPYSIAAQVGETLISVQTLLRLHAVLDGKVEALEARVEALEKRELDARNLAVLRDQESAAERLMRLGRAG